MSESGIGAHGDYGEIRNAVRALCAEFPSEYHRKIDEARGYVAEHVLGLPRSF